MDQLDWKDDAPRVPGHYWYSHPASHEPPVLVRVKASNGELAVRFEGMAVDVPLRMLEGARWAEPVAARR